MPPSSTQSSSVSFFLFYLSGALLGIIVDQAGCPKSSAVK